MSFQQLLKSPSKDLESSDLSRDVLVAVVVVSPVREETSTTRTHVNTHTLHAGIAPQSISLEEIDKH